MKVAYLSRSIIPSMEANSVHVMKMCAAMARMGSDVVLIHEADDEIELPLGLEEVNSFYDVENNFRRVRLLSPVAFAKARLHAIRAARIAKSHRANLALCRDVLSCYRAVRKNLRSIIELHSLPPITSQTGKKLIDLLSSDYLICVVVITHALKRDFVAAYDVDLDRVVVCPDASDDVLKKTPKDLAADCKKCVGYLGSMLPGKGVEIIASLPNLCPDISFHVVGGAPEQVLRWKEKMAKSTNITFHGHVPPSDTGHYLTAFDVVLAPNQPVVLVKGGTDIGRYTSPLKIFEYMSAGKPIIASALPVLQEVLQHDRNGWLVRHDAINEWRDAIYKLTMERETASRLGRTARSDFEEHWSWDARAKKILSLVGKT
jgi:glycosyltransferase involved in cell wall biosynthesis